MIFIINAQGTITAVSPSPVHQGSIGVNDIILVSPALADGVTLNATLPNGIKIDPINMALVYPSDIEGYTEGYYIYRITLNESVTQYTGLLSLRFSIKIKEGGTLTTSTAVIPIVEDMGIIEPLSIPSLDNNADIGNIIDTVNEIITKLNNINTNVSSAVNAANAADGYREQAKAWATGEIGDNNTPVEAWTPQYNNNAKYYAGESAASATQSAASANRSENSAIESELWATGSHNNVPYTKVEQTKNNAKYYAQSTQNLLESISISYDYETYKLTIEYTLPNSSVVTKEYDFALEPSIVSIDEVEKDGKYYLSLTLANGNKTEIELDDIFEGFVKAQADINNARKVYGISSSGTNALFPLDSIKYPYFNGSLVQRGSDGSIYLPSDTMDPRCAASVNMCEQNLIIAEDYTDNKFTEAKKDVTDLEKRLDQLESATLKYTEYSGLTDAVPVPENAAKFALVNKVGGMTYKSENLWDPSKQGYPEEYGITVNSDNSITFNGYIEDYYLSIPQESGYDALVTLSLGTSVFDDSTNNYISLSRYDEENDMWDESSVIIQNGCASWHNTFEAYLHLNGTFDNLTIYPMLVKGSTPKPYQPPFEGLRDTKVTALVSKGVNLLNTQAELSVPSDTNSNDTTPRTFIPNTIVLGMAHNNYYNPDAVSLISRTKDSITFTNRNGYGLSFYFELKPNTKYTISCKSSIDILQTAVLFYNVDGTVDYFEADRATSKTFTTNYCGKTLIVFVDIDASYGDNTTVTLSDVMLNEGTSVPYKPYRGTIDTLRISAEIQSLEGYGKGVEGYPNYIDFERKVFVQNSYDIVFDGVTEGKKVGTVTTYNGLYYASVVLPYSSFYLYDGKQMIISHFTSKGTEIYVGKAYIAGSTFKNLVMYNTDQTLTTVDAWNAWLKEQYDSGNPVTLVYAMATPIERKISGYLTDDEIEVEGGGTIVPVNEYNNAAFVEMLFTEKK